MNLFEKISHIYIQVEPCDLRKGIDGYAALVTVNSTWTQWTVTASIFSVTGITTS